MESHTKKKLFSHLSAIITSGVMLELWQYLEYCMYNVEESEGITTAYSNSMIPCCCGKPEFSVWN